jgi:hypothetical protein
MEKILQLHRINITCVITGARNLCIATPLRDRLINLPAKKRRELVLKGRGSVKTLKTRTYLNPILFLLKDYFLFEAHQYCQKEKYSRKESDQERMASYHSSTNQFFVYIVFISMSSYPSLVSSCKPLRIS